MTTTTAPPVLAPAPAAADRAPRWPRIGLLVLLVGAAVLYLWDLGASGYANSFYAAAAQAGTMSWKALLFGSLDPGNVITVDKPPAALWLMGLSGRIFGFSSWSMLVPQALCGVASVALVHATVKRWSGAAAGLLAGAAFALTPVAVMMFRFNNPDALLVLLLCVAGYATTRAVERGSTRWLLLAGTAIGFGFLTKMLQAFLVLPALALVYLVAAPVRLWRRVGQLLAAGVAVLVSGGWLVALVAVWPADSRPYIGGSTNNSLLELALGYNGLGRIFGQGPRGGGPVSGPVPEGAVVVGPGGGGTAPAGFGGATGLTRMFGSSVGAEVSWLLPAALVALVAGLWFTRRAPRTDRTRAALLLWGGWLVVTALVFSFMGGIFHPYYSVALAPAIGALVGVGGVELWRGRRNPSARITLAALVAVTGVWDGVLLARTPSWHPELRWAVLGVTALAATAVAVGVDGLRRLRPVVVVAALLAGFLGTGGYALATAATPHTGSIPNSGPVSGGPAGFGGPAPRGEGSAQVGGLPERRASAQLIALLRGAHTRWAAATQGAQGAGDLQLASGVSVMGIGGFSGSDPAPTLARFQRYVAAGEVRYYVGGGMLGGPMGGDGSAGSIGSWVRAHFTAISVAGQTVYDLSKPIS